MTQKKTIQRVAQHNFAIVCARGLGDALLSMVLAHNLQLSGKQVTIFSTILCELKDWFPGFQIIPSPPPSENFYKVFSAFDTILAADHSLLNESHQFGNELIILKESAFDKKRTIVDNLQVFCEQQLFLPFFMRENGILPPKDLKFRANPTRVLIHPLSTEDKRNWPMGKFLALAEALEQEGYRAYFCMSPTEAAPWRTLVAEDRLPYFPTMSVLASFVYESGFLIGNNSGVGHLASALHIPTLSLFARKSYSRLWRPGWGPGIVTCPPNILIGSSMKHKYWKKILSVRRVKNSFNQLNFQYRNFLNFDRVKIEN